jgi:hypothetical protein
MECGCGGPAALRLFGAGFAEDAGANRVANADFADGSVEWNAWGSRSFVPTGLGDGAYVELAVRHGESSALNSDPFPVSTGAPFVASFDATVDYRSAGSGRFVVIFLGANGEVARIAQPFATAVTTYTAHTDRYGVFRVTILDPDVDAFEVLATNVAADDRHRISAGVSLVAR